MNFQTIKNNFLNILMGEVPDELKGYDIMPANDPNYFLNSPKAVGYQSIQEQSFLYSNMFIGFNPNINTLLDIGCGRGDIFQFIVDFYAVSSFNYTGIERAPHLVDAGYRKYGLTLTIGDFQKIDLPKNDWVSAIGVFFERRTQSEPADMQLLLEDIKRMYNAANTVVTFNMLSPINNEIIDGMFYVHPGLLLDMLIEDYTFVTLKHNYSQSIYTVTIYKY